MFSKSAQIVIKLLTVDGIWIYKFDPQRRVNYEKCMCKDQAKPVIVREKAWGKVHMLFLNSDSSFSTKAQKVTGKFYKNNLLSK